MVGDVVELNGVRYEVDQVAGRAVDSALVELPADTRQHADGKEDESDPATAPD